jgi:hypothetical protein
VASSLRASRSAGHSLSLFGAVTVLTGGVCSFSRHRRRFCLCPGSVRHLRDPYSTDHLLVHRAGFTNHLHGPAGVVSIDVVAAGAAG